MAEPRCRGHDLVLDLAGDKAPAQADLAGRGVVFALGIEAGGVGQARTVDHRGRGQRIVFLAALDTARGPGRDLVVEVPFGACRRKQVLGIGIGPGLGVVGLVVRHVGNEVCARRHAGARGLELVLLVADIGRHAHIARAPVEAQAQRREAAVLAVDGRAAVAAHRVQAQAGAVVGAEAARQIDRGRGLAARLHAQVDAVQRLIARALGHQVDRAAQVAAARGRTVEKSAGAMQHFDALEEFGRHILARQQAVQAVVGQVVRIHRQAPQHIEFLEIAEAARTAHGRVVEQHFANALGLLVADQRIRIAGQLERRVHDVLLAQQAHAPALGNLPAGKRLGQAFGRRIGAGLDGHRLQRGRRRRLCAHGTGGGPQSNGAYSWAQDKRWCFHENEIGNDSR